jgi:hypothetical protein
MQTLYNHTLYPLEAYVEHSPAKFVDFQQNGGNYGARILACSTPDDIVQLDPSLREPYKYLFDHLGQIGLDVAGDIEWDTRAEVAADFPSHDLSVYLFDPTINAVRPDPRRLDATTKFGDKNSFIEFCQQQGYSVPRTMIVTDGTMPDISDLKCPLYVKAAESSNGKGLFRVTNKAELEEAIGSVGSNYQIQEEVPGVPISVQYHEKDDVVSHLATTDQILDGHTHMGNYYPTVHNPREVTDKLADELVAAGLRDTFGLDVMVNGEESTIIECNPRWTGATYPTVAAGRLAIKEWSAYVLPTQHERPRDIKLGDTLYDASSQIGVVIMNNCRLNAHGKVEVLIAGPQEAQEEMMIKLEKRLKKPNNADAMFVARTQAVAMQASKYSVRPSLSR